MKTMNQLKNVEERRCLSFIDRTYWLKTLGGSLLPNTLPAYGVLFLVLSALMGMMAYQADKHLRELHVLDPIAVVIAEHSSDLASLMSTSSKQANISEHLPAINQIVSQNTHMLIKASGYIFLVACVLLCLFGFYNISLSIDSRRIYLRSALRDAMSKKNLVVHYQPIVDMKSGIWVGAEALLRWPTKPEFGSPAIFIPLIEKAGMMTCVTRWVCEQVCEEHASTIWACDSFYITINLSAEDVVDSTFPEFVAQLLNRYQIDTSRIVFEVTEGAMIDAQVAMVQLNKLRTQGHLIALDDFGTGYSSLSHLAQLPVDILKIDRSFVVVNQGDPAHMILSHIVEIARKLKLKVIVEGVETPGQFDRVVALGALTAQGWFYSKDLPVDALVRGYFSVKHPMSNALI